MTDLCRSMTDLCHAISTDNLALSSPNWEIDQRHQEQINLLETKRQEIESLEEQFQQRESMRLQEQQALEVQLEERKQELETILKEAESAKKEAEQAKIEAVQETAIWKRRSLDVERQLTEWRMNSGRKDSNDSADLADGEVLHCGTRSPAKSPVKTERMSDILEEGLEKLRTSQLADKQQLQRRVNVLEQELENRFQQVEEIKEKGDADNDVEVLVKQKHILELQVDELSRMKSDVQGFFSLSEDHHLDGSTLHRLREESAKVASALELAEQLESRIDGESVMKKQEKQSWLSQQQEQLNVDRALLHDDRNYLRELEESVLLSNEEIPPEEMAAIAEEKARIEELHQKYNDKEREFEQKIAEEMALIEAEQSERLEGVLEEKATAQHHWEQTVGGELQQRQLQIKELDSLQKATGDAVKRLEQLQEEVQSTEQELQEKRLHLQELEERQTDELQRATQEVQRLQQQINTHEMENEVSLIHSQLQSLARLLESDGGSNPDVDIFEQCRKFTEAAATYNEQQKAEGAPRIDASECAVDDLETQLNRVEHELREQRESYAQQRQQELDTIDMKRFHLQEMEDQERINALVEQEVKRRLLEERVEREKMRRMEREREKLLREREIWRIRRAHARDLEILKQKFDPRDGNADEMTLRKANPYTSLVNTGGYNAERHLHRMVRPLTISFLLHDLSSYLKMPARSMSALNTLNNTRVHENPFHISIPSFAHRGSGLDGHYDFEVKCMVLDETWTLFRRYSRFRELHLDLRKQYPEISALIFPPKRWFSSYSDKIAEERKQHLEDYLQNLLNVLFHRRNCILHPSKTLIYSKQVLCNFHPFFKKGVFESGKYSSG
ncbi:hypothetical protein CAPTEDRAFT_195906 [Capitella teleta]|uniref:PX domain-containing protein n=1 Tax=Capitella teleta TaxID=283909 RepID=R7U5B1_CAPTE|nr:hypothetical protein CAPTEDRAFT_195906 [Capitella teleta]|eukprot:ELT98871.1 hypothetical protein CAPTEDRAFT_195906 [Capitella teleta]